MRDMNMDEAADKSASAAYDSFQHETSGDTGVAISKMQNSLKYASRAGDSLDEANLQASVAMNVTAGSVAPVAAAAPMGGTSYNTIMAPAQDANARVVQYTQRAKYIAGRAFFQNGNQWVDNNVSAQNSANATRIKFGSDEYFTLLTQHPEARPWLALGQNVKLLLGSSVYDIYGDSSATN
jgi:hypothetical protein